MTTEHCWHPRDDHDYDRCCFCGAIRMKKFNPIKGHGEFAPLDCTQVTYVGGEQSCIEHEPPPKKDGCPF